MQLHHKHYGQGEPLIILHGLFGSSDNWHGIAPQLAERFSVYCLDLRNHGHSPHSAEMNFDVMAQDVVKFIEAHHLSYVVVMGHSLGGKVAMQLALTHPDKLRSLVVVDIAPRAYDGAHEPILDALLSVNLDEFHSRAQIQHALSAAIPDPATRHFLLKNVAGEGRGTFRWKPNLRDIRANYARLIEAIPAKPARQFTKPTLFIRGGKSGYVADTDWPSITRMFPCPTLETIPEAGHWVHADCPDQFIACVRGFVN